MRLYIGVPVECTIITEWFIFFFFPDTSTAVVLSTTTHATKHTPTASSTIQYATTSGSPSRALTTQPATSTNLTTGSISTTSALQTSTAQYTTSTKVQTIKLPTTSFQHAVQTTVRTSTPSTPNKVDTTHRTTALSVSTPTLNSPSLLAQTTSSLQSHPADPVHCCCKCCSDTDTTMSTRCRYCSNDSLNLAADCAAHAPVSFESKHSTSRNAEVPNLMEPHPLNGSTFPGRLAYSPSFLETEIFTEQLAEMSVQQKTGLGFQINDMLLDCQFEGQPCNMSRFVLALFVIQFNLI